MTIVDISAVRRATSSYSPHHQVKDEVLVEAFYSPEVGIHSNSWHPDDVEGSARTFFVRGMAPRFIDNHKVKLKTGHDRLVGPYR